LTDRIFEAFAPAYWAAGLPVIPLRTRNKMPDIMNWSLYGRQMPTELEQRHWLASFPTGNIGLPLGPASGICIIDIDTEDAELDAGDPRDLRSYAVGSRRQEGSRPRLPVRGAEELQAPRADGGMLCEFLGMGNQVVVPPSIHPDTGQPYTASAELWDVLKDKLPCLGEDIEDKLRALLGAKGFEIGAGGRSSPIDMVPAGERDVQMVRHAGYLARVVLGIDRSAQFSLWEAVVHMTHWVTNYTAKVSGDAMDPNKGVAKLLEFLLKDVEKGRTMPDGWDADMPDQLREHDSVKRMFELNASQRWDLNKAVSWLSGKVAEKPQDKSWALAKIQELVGEVAKDENFPDFEFRALIGDIIRLGGKELSLKKSDLLILFKEARRGVDEGETESHVIIARTVLEELQRTGEIRHDHGQFWQWNGACFQKLDEDELYMHVANNVKDSMLVRRNADYKAIVEVLQRMTKGLLVQSEERGINFANGFVGEDLELVEHDPKFGTTFTLPFNYDRDNATRCNRWLEFLHSTWGHEPDFQERHDALQEMFAGTLFKIATHYQRAFLLFGRAGTGKTQVLQVLRSMLPPDAIAELGPQQWNERFALVDLIGKAANICGELPENGMITGNVFKEVVEGSPVRTEFKNQDGFVFSPVCAQWFASNYLPVSRDSTRGFIRRWLILDFNKPVREEDKVENLAQLIVAEEREAIAAWALEGLRRLLDNRGYTLPVCHHRRISQMRRINNSVHAFIEDTKLYVRDADGSVGCRGLFDSYAFHQREVLRSTPVSFERFMQMVEDLEMEVQRDAIGDFIVHGISEVVK
jgi:putative DNA primase/helicase